LVYVGGGSLVNLLALWRSHGLHEALAEAWANGVVLAGVSAGAMRAVRERARQRGARG
jgi:peptidase E